MLSGTEAAGQESESPAPYTPENLGTPTESYQAIDTVMGEDAAGRPTLYGTTYNALTKEGAVFYGIDAVTGEKRTQLAMPGTYGAYHVAKAPDGRIYIGNQTPDMVPEIWQYDPATDKVKLAATITGAYGFCFGITVAPGGKVYCGMYNGGIYEYDPASGAQRYVSPTRAYPKALLMLDDTHMVIGQGTTASVVVLNVITGLSKEYLPSTYSGIGFAYNIARVGDSVYAQLAAPGDTIVRFSIESSATLLGEELSLKFVDEVTGLTGMSFASIGGNEFVALGKRDEQSKAEFMRVTDGAQLQLTPTGVSGPWMSPVRYQPEADTVVIDGDTWVAGIGNGNGMFGRWNTRTGDVWTRQVTLPGAPATITAMGAGPDGNVYGGTYETQAAFRFSPATKETTNLGVVTTQAAGEVLSMVKANGKLFMGSYTDNIITVYDPTKPWNPGPGADNNPLDLGPAGDDQYRPWDMKVGSDGRVWVTSAAAYGKLGGALTAIDPVTYEIESFRYLAGNQHLFSVAAGDGVLYIGTSRFGDNSDAGGEAQLLVFDLATEKVVQTVTVPGTTRVTALAMADDGRLYGSSDVNGGASYWFRYDPATGKPTWFGQFPHGIVSDLIAGPDGFIYGLTQNGVFRVQPDTAEITLLGGPGGRYYSTLAFDDDGRLYWGSGATLMRIATRPEREPSADVSVEVTTSASRMQAGGDPATFTVSVANAGPDGSTGVSVDNDLVLPDGASIKDVRVPPGTNFDPNTKRWSVGDLPAGAALKLDIIIESNRRTRGDATLRSLASAITADHDDTNNAGSGVITIGPGRRR